MKSRTKNTHDTDQPLDVRRKRRISSSGSQTPQFTSSQQDSRKKRPKQRDHQPLSATSSSSTHQYPPHISIQLPPRDALGRLAQYPTAINSPESDLNTPLWSQAGTDDGLASADGSCASGLTPTSSQWNVRELQFTPLSTALDNRTKRRLRRSHLSETYNSYEEHHREDARTRKQLEELRREVEQRNEHVQTLEREIEVLGQRGRELNDEENEKIRRLEDEIELLKRQAAEKQHEVDTMNVLAQEEENWAAFDGGYDDHDISLTTVDSMDISQEMDASEIPQTENALAAMTPVSSLSTADAGTQLSSSDHTHEVEIDNFRREITDINRSLGDAKAIIQYLSIELRSLGFAAEDVSNEKILSSIRNAFRNARSTVETALPSSNPRSLDNATFLNMVVKNLQSMMEQIRSQSQTIAEHVAKETALVEETSRLTEALADTEARREEIEKHWQKLDIEIDNKSRDMVLVEEQVMLMYSLIDERDKMVEQQETKINELTEETTNQSQSIDRLKHALKSYDEEVTGLQNLVTRMEEQHQEALFKLNMVHGEEVAELQGKLGETEASLKTAEEDIEAKVAFIKQLEAKIETAEANLETLRNDLSQLKEYADSEKQRREETEQELETKRENVAFLSNKLSLAEKALDALHDEVTTLRERLQSERQQREVTEGESEERRKRIQDLEEEIRVADSMASELHEQLLEVQSSKEAMIKELQDAAAATEVRHQAEMDSEMEKRREVEGIVDQRDATIAQLKDAIHANELEIEELVKERNVAEATIVDLQAEAADADEAHQKTLSEQMNKIKDISAQLDRATREIRELEGVKESLERRVEDGAVQMLEQQSSHADEVNKLQGIIRSRKTDIAILNQELANKERHFTDALENKEKEIDALKLESATRASHIQRLVSQLENVKAKFRQHSADSRETIEAMTKELQAHTERAEARHRGFIRRADTTSQEVEDIDADGIDLHGSQMSSLFDLTSQSMPTVPVGSSPNGVKEKHPTKALKKRRRMPDSGIGFAMDEELAMEYVNDMNAIGVM